MKGLRFRLRKDNSNAQLLKTGHEKDEGGQTGGLLAQSTGQEYMDSLCALFLRAGKIPGFWMRRKIWRMG